MLLRKLTLAIVTAAAVLPALSAGAQYYDPYRRPPPPYGYDRPLPPRYDYQRPRYNDDDDDDAPAPNYRSRRFGEMCVTSRGECSTRPGPINAPCRCYIDGFGEKRGAIQ